MPARKKIDPLPDTLSGLIRVALKDLKKAEASPLYEISMDDWHSPQTDGRRCSVCYAGAVMAGTLKASPLATVKPDDWWDGICGKLNAINDLREGDIVCAANSLGWEGAKYVAASAFWATHQELLAEIPSYGTGKREREAFHEAQRKLANALAKAGL